MKKTIRVIVLVLVLVLLTGCRKVDLLSIDFNVDGNTTELNYDKTNPLVAINIEDYGAIVIELYPDKAENTVNNFISLVSSGFYDGNSFHRLMPGFVLQGGDPEGTGAGGPGYSIKGEFKINGYDNDLKHKKGIVSMARRNDYNSAGSQFFIVLKDNEYLDENYAAFGKVIDGYKVIETIEEDAIVIDKESGQMNHNIKILKALVDKKDYSPKKVEKVK